MPILGREDLSCNAVPWLCSSVSTQDLLFWLLGEDTHLNLQVSNDFMVTHDNRPEQ